VFKPEQVKSAIGNSGKFDPNSASLTDPLKPGERNPRSEGATMQDRIAAAERARDERNRSAWRSEGTNALPPPERVTIEPEAKPTKGEAVQSPESQRVAELAKERPDVAAALESAKAVAAEEVKEAGLVQAALECALSFGA
jgi:hypothetical protein